MQTAKDFINRWHHIITQQNMDGLDALLAENVVFSSPVVFTPIPGKELTKMYLIAAGFTFNMEQFQTLGRYMMDCIQSWNLKLLSMILP